MRLINARATLYTIIIPCQNMKSHTFSTTWNGNMLAYQQENHFGMYSMLVIKFLSSCLLTLGRKSSKSSLYHFMSTRTPVMFCV